MVCFAVMPCFVCVVFFGFAALEETSRRTQLSERVKTGTPHRPLAASPPRLFRPTLEPLPQLLAFLPGRTIALAAPTPMRTDVALAAATGAAVGGAAVLLAHKTGWLGGRRAPSLNWGDAAVAPAAKHANGGGGAQSQTAPTRLSAATLASDPVVREQLTRNIQFLGAEGQAALADALVIVVGLGGVGSHAAHHLLRAGVGRLRLIDFDQVSRYRVCALRERDLCCAFASLF